jgi:hypothetical protein
MGIAFPTPRRSFNIAIIDGTLQISKLPLSFGFLELNHFAQDSPKLGLAIFDTTREPGTHTTRKNRVWVCYNRVRVDPIMNTINKK